MRPDSGVSRGGQTRRLPAKWIILKQLLKGLRLRSRIIPTTVRGTELSTAAKHTTRYAKGLKCFAAYLRRLSYQDTSLLVASIFFMECPPSWIARTEGAYWAG